MGPPSPPDDEAIRRDKRYAALRWVPVPQLIGLIAFVVLAEVALWLHRRQSRKQHGTD